MVLYQSDLSFSTLFLSLLPVPCMQFMYYELNFLWFSECTKLFPAAMYLAMMILCGTDA